MAGGIYQIRQLSTGKKYIGSTHNFALRKTNHVSELNCQSHLNPYLLSAWQKYGEDDFVFEILEVVQDESQLLIREQWYLDNVVVWRFDFNIATVADCPPSFLGKKRTVRTEEHKRKIGDGNRGKTMSEEARKKISETMKRKGLKGPSTRGIKKKPLTEEQRKKHSIALTGRKMPRQTEEHKQKISEAHKGMKASEESKRKMSENGPISLHGQATHPGRA